MMLTHQMIMDKSMELAVLTGFAAVLIGVFPGLAELIERLRSSSPLIPVRIDPPLNTRKKDQVDGQIWFAVGGVVLLLVVLLVRLFG